MPLRVYAYSGCGTCRKALKLLEARGVACEVIPIREQPPTRTELKRMLALCGGNVRKLFNTSGQTYKEMKLSERLPAMTQEEALDLLSKHGNLVKRPFVLTATSGTVGFNEDEWRRFL
ncbi:MAG TPA: arsenate reductase family protein [Verrucomicrobiae bacterium]|jgi:arsenate reductase